MGRKDKYETIVRPRLKEIGELYKKIPEYKLCNDVLHISVSSWQKYKAEHKELRDFLDSVITGLIGKCRDAMQTKAFGFEYTETKETIRYVKGEEESRTVEKITRYSPPDVGALHLLLKNLDDTWTNDDKQTLELKRQKLELEKLKEENGNW